MKDHLNLYVGSPESDPFGSYIYLDKVMADGTEIPLIDGKLNLADMSENDAITYVENVANLVKMFQEESKLPVEISFEEFAEAFIEEDFSERSIKYVKSILRELRTNSNPKGKLSNG